MLRELLRLTAGMGTARTTELAQALGVNRALAQQMLETLEREGYLKSVVQGCALPCESCPQEVECLFCNQPRIWILTEKGQKLLAKDERFVRTR
ncbi:MAG TPA: helix-turn-helix domain-containing protein [Candidatus Binatia bacterium]|jgi:hypothetical protein